MEKGWHGEEIARPKWMFYPYGSWLYIEQINVINRGCNELECLNGDRYNARGN